MTGDGMVQLQKTGRGAAFLELVTRFEAPLCGFVRQRVGSAQLAGDIVQQTFLRAWAHAGFDPSRGDAQAFLFTTASHLITDWLRSEASASVSLDEISARGSLVPSMIDGRARDPLARMMAQERADALHAALARLPAEYREVLERFYLRQEGNQFRIAQAMGLSVAAFNSRLNRARLELKRILTALRGDRE
jgi:RNA polymerase sigma-70 factor (ECF subfamily)